MGYETSPRELQCQTGIDLTAVALSSVTCRKATITNMSTTLDVTICVMADNNPGITLIPGGVYNFEPPASFRFNLAELGSYVEGGSYAILHVLYWT